MEANPDRRLVAGRYALGAPLGRGGMGTVWRAEDVLLGRAVAVKEIELPGGPGPAGRAGLRDRALREARAAARLNHPGAVTLHDVVDADDRLFLVMELVEAPTLRELVDTHGPLRPAVAAHVGLELLEALEAAHRAGIVHHDVKPANVLVEPGGRVKLADFGIASLQEDTQRTLAWAAAGPSPDHPAGTGGAAFGSLPYVAPEQAGGGRAGPAADLWALGATLWFAVEGDPPFERGHPAATLGAILHDPPGQPTRAGPLTPVLLALLVKDPDRRPRAAALRRLLQPVAAPALDPAVPAAGPAATARLAPDPAAPTEVLADPAPPPSPTAPDEAGWGMPPPAPAGPARPAWGEPRPEPPPSRGRRRRWWRRLLVAAVVLVVLGALADGQRREGRGPAGLGDPVRDGQFEFVVRSVRCGVGEVGEGLGRRRALEQFCLVRLEVENTGREGRTFGGGQQYLFDTAGNRHDPQLDATVHHGSPQLVATHLNPGQRLAGTLVYDLPDPVELDRIELHDAPFSGGVSVELG